MITLGKLNIIARISFHGCIFICSIGIQNTRRNASQILRVHGRYKDGYKDDLIFPVLITLKMYKTNVNNNIQFKIIYFKNVYLKE